jgi:hypothetical protein
MKVDRVLTSRELFLLEWLSKEDASPLGECEGAILTTLVDLGLASIGPTPTGKHRHYAPVTVTEAGWSALAEQQDANHERK